jgi:spectinomycin phosphotransferase
VSDEAVLELVDAHWERAVDQVTHLPVGFGAHHWRAAADGVPVWFATWDRLGSRHRLETLAAAYDGAIELAAQGLEFVLAPVRDRFGSVVVPLAGGALSCTPWADGTPVGDGYLTDPTTAAANVADLARLHAAVPPADIPRWRPLVGHDLPERLAVSLSRPWTSGPYGERARTAVEPRLGDIEDWTSRYLGLAASSGERRWTATHGETHTANQLRTRDGIRFVDWESLKLAPRERDLTTLVQAGYAAEVAADPAMVELFDLEWRLSEIDEYARWFAAEHTGTDDDRIAFGGLQQELVRGSWWPTA